MRKEDLLESDFLKQFKSGEELESFLSELHKRGIEKMLEAELDVHLGYDKHSKSENANARNGYSSKTIKSDYGERNKSAFPGIATAASSPLWFPNVKDWLKVLNR